MAVFGSRRMKGIPDQAIERELRKYFRELKAVAQQFNHVFAFLRPMHFRLDFMQMFPQVNKMRVSTHLSEFLEARIQGRKTANTWLNFVRGPKSLGLFSCEWNTGGSWWALAGFCVLVRLVRSAFFRSWQTAADPNSSFGQKSHVWGKDQSGPSRSQ